MNKVFIGLLIIAAGAGIFFFLHKQNQKEKIAFNKEWMIGKWKLDSVAYKKDTGTQQPGLFTLLDSFLLKYRYQFNADSTVAISLGDSLIKAHSYYQWTKQDNLLLKDNTTDSTGELFTVNRLQTDSLIMQSEDSVRFFFVKIK